MSKDYFTVESTALTIRKSGALAIWAGDKPRKNENGSTSYSLRAPLLILPQDLFENGEEELRKVCYLLNQHAHLFFSSAANPNHPDAAILHAEQQAEAAAERAGEDRA